jgi:hypothetical protein
MPEEHRLGESTAGLARWARDARAIGAKEVWGSTDVDADRQDWGEVVVDDMADS